MLSGTRPQLRSRRVPESIKASAAGVAGLSYESIGQREEAVKHLKRALELSPLQENSYLALAFLYEKAQRFKEAVEVLQQARKQIPGSLNSCYRWGTTWSGPSNIRPVSTS